MGCSPFRAGKSLATLETSCGLSRLDFTGSRHHANYFAGSRPLQDYMDDNAPKENPPAGFNKLDLTQLQGFSFGTQWTQDKSPPPDQRERGERPRREDRRDSAGPGGGGAPDRRDRRAFRKPVGAPSGVDGGAAPGGPVAEQPRQNFSGDRAPR